MGVVLFVTLAVAACACLAPGWKASRENPASALRSD